MALRPTQVETLRFVDDGREGEMDALELAGRLNTHAWSAWLRLDHLARTGHLQRRSYADGARFYLTQLGKEALESSE